MVAYAGKCSEPGEWWPFLGLPSGGQGRERFGVRGRGVQVPGQDWQGPPGGVWACGSGGEAAIRDSRLQFGEEPVVILGNGVLFASAPGPRRQRVPRRGVLLGVAVSKLGPQPMCLPFSLGSPRSLWRFSCMVRRAQCALHRDGDLLCPPGVAADAGRRGRDLGWGCQGDRS